MKTPSLKILAVLFGLPLLVAVADWAWTQGPEYRFRSDGVYANYTIEESFQESAGTFTAYSYRRAYVEISQGAQAMATGGISGPYFLLNFQISVERPTGYGYAYGSGPISASYVTLDNPVNQNLSLSVNTQSLGPPFYKYSYGTIPVQFPNIDLRWTRTNNDWYRWEGHRVTERGTLVEHRQGSGVEYFAIPTGTITLPDIGLPPQWVYMDGWLGSQKANTTVIRRGPPQ